MVENIDISRKFKWLSLAAMVSVVMIHSIAILTTKDPARWNVFVQHLIFRSFTYWAVPFFFACSGFWFARGKYVVDVDGVSGIRQLKIFWLKKVRTLLVPYLLWVIIAVVLILPLTAGNNYLTHRWIFERTFIDNVGVWGKVDGLFGITRFEPAANGPLWYLRSLMLLFVAAPVWRWLARLRWGWCCLLALWLVETLVFPMNVACLHLGAGAIGWFALGIVVAVRKWECVQLPNWALALAAGAWSFAALTKVLHMTGLDYLPPALLSRVVELIPYGGILFLWGAYERSGLSRIEVRPWMKETFWVYCCHQIPSGWFIATFLFVLGKHDVATLTIAVANVFFVLLIAFGSVAWFRRKCPGPCAVLTGGR